MPDQIGSWSLPRPNTGLKRVNKDAARDQSRQVDIPFHHHQAFDKVETSRLTPPMHLFGVNSTAGMVDTDFSGRNATCETTHYPLSSSGSWTGDDVFYPPRGLRNKVNKNIELENGSWLQTEQTRNIAHYLDFMSYSHELEVQQHHNAKMNIIIKWLEALPTHLLSPHEQDEEPLAPLSPLVETERGTMRRWKREWDLLEQKRSLEDDDIWPVLQKV